MVGAADDADVRIARRPGAGVDFTALAKRLRGADLSDVREAVVALSQTRAPEALPLLWKLYADGDAMRRLIALRGIGRLNLPGQEPKLLHVALNEAYMSLRLCAADELARLEGTERAAARLAAALNAEASALLRVRAVQALGRVGGGAAAECLRKLLTGTSPELAVAAADSQASLQPGDAESSLSALVDGLQTAGPELKPAIADALERLSGRDYRYDLIQWTQWLRQPGRALATVNRAPGSEADGYATAPAAREPRGIDVVVVFDTTASMTHLWPQLGNAICNVLGEMMRQSPSARLGSVRYRAALPEATLNYLTKVRPLTRQHESVQKEFVEAAFGGSSGGLHLGLDEALSAQPWRVDARKVVILVGDTSPPSAGLRACLQMSADAAQMDGVVVNVLYVRSQHGAEQFEAYRTLAASASGCFYEFDKAERRLVEVGKTVRESPAEIAAKWSTRRTRDP